jgi:hypothetical protein
MLRHINNDTGRFGGLEIGLARKPEIAIGGGEYHLG